MWVKTMFREMLHCRVIVSYMCNAPGFYSVKCNAPSFHQLGDTGFYIRAFGLELQTCQKTVAQD